MSLFPPPVDPPLVALVSWAHAYDGVLDGPLKRKFGDPPLDSVLKTILVHPLVKRHDPVGLCDPAVT